MYILLRRLIARINQQAMDYFVDKLKAYDSLIDDKEEKLKDLNNLIDNKEEELDKKEEETSSGGEIYLYDYKPITYKDEDIFKKLKDVNEKFDLDNEKIVKDFFKKVYNDNTSDIYNKCCLIREKLTQEKIFSLMTIRKKQQLEELKKILGDSSVILDDFMSKNKNFDLKKFISYFNKIITSMDPHVYIYVGNENEKYDNYNKNVVMIVDDSIFKGIRILYKGKLYDYSL